MFNNVVILIFRGFAQTFVTWLIALIGIALSLVAVMALKPTRFRQSRANAAQTTG